MDWIERNWLTIVSVVSPLAIISGVLGVIRVVLSKKLSPPVLRFEAVRERGTMPSELFILIRVTSDPLEGLSGTIFKRRDIPRAMVHAQFKYDGSVIYDGILETFPDGAQSIGILADGSPYDFLLVSKQQGYAEGYLESGPGYHDKRLPAKTDILCAISVMEGRHILGQASCVIHNPDANIENFKAECLSD